MNGGGKDSGATVNGAEEFRDQSGILQLIYIEKETGKLPLIPAFLTKIHFSPPSLILLKRSQQLNDLTIKSHIVAST